MILAENISFMIRNSVWLLVEITDISIYKSEHNSNFLTFSLPCNSFFIVFFFWFGLFMVQMYCEDNLLVPKTVFCLIHPSYLKILSQGKYLIFFYLGFHLQTVAIHRIAGEEGSYFFSSYLSIPLASETPRH